MSKKVDKDVEKAMLKALDGLKQMSHDLKEKQNKRFWGEIAIPFTLHEGLSRYTKDELDDIRKHLDLKNASSLRKAELITLLQETIPSVLEKLCLELDEERFELLSKMAHNDGYINAPNLETTQISYFRKSGLIYTGTFHGKRVLALPTKLTNLILTLEKDQELNVIVSRNTEWIKLTHGLLYYNGTLNLAELQNLLETYSSEPPIYLREYIDVMHNANSYRKEHYVNTEGYSNIRVFDSKKVKQEHRMRKSLSFYPFSKEQLLEAGEPEFVDRNKSYQQLVNFIMGNYVIDRDEADSLAEECVYATRNGDGPGEVLEYLGGRLEFESLESVQALMDRVVYLMNFTREWFLKGYTSTELREKEKPFLQPLPITSDMKPIRSFKKIGRNEPCLCGSGKKYKKCCGK